MNIINGGKHRQQCGPQEFMVTPIGAPNFREALRYAAETFHALRDILIKKDYATGVGDEGGFAPNLKSNAEPFELIVQAIEKAGYKPGEDVAIAIDAAASSFYKNGKYILASEKDPERTAEEMIDFYEELIKKYPIVSIEDGLTSGLGRMEKAHETAGEQGPDRRRRPLCHQRQVPCKGHKGKGRQLGPHQGQPDRHPDRDHADRRDGPQGRFHHGLLPPLRRDRRLLAGGCGGRIQRGPAQDRLHLPRRAPGKINQLIRIEEELGASAVFGKDVLYSIKK
jgi:hypothetical protein